MNERERQISWVMSIIQDLCESYEIGIVPYKRPNGSLIVSIIDAKNGKKYALINNKEVTTNE